MTRTQIQLPDEVYARAKTLCEAREISLAELGWKGLNDAQIKEQAQLTSSELSLTKA